MMSQEEREAKAVMVRDLVDEWIRLSDPARVERNVRKWVKPSRRTAGKVSKQAKLEEVAAAGDYVAP